MRGKVAIITATLASTEEEYCSAQIMAAKYGDRIVHLIWPHNFMFARENMFDISESIAADPKIKAVVFNQAIPGTNAVVDKLLETRKDIFIIYCTAHEPLTETDKRANLVLMFDEIAMGNRIPLQAQKLGAKVLVHYSFPRHMAVLGHSRRRDLMKAKCAEIGLEFVDAEFPDPIGPGFPAASRFFNNNVPKMVAKYGKDTAFFGTNCRTQTPLIKAVIDAGAIYPQPCCPSPYHGFPAALGIKSDLENPDNLWHVIDETKRILKEKGLEGRFSTWPVPASSMFTSAGTEYAMKVISGEAGFDSINNEVLNKCFLEYAKSGLTLTHYADSSGREYSKFFMILMEYLTY